MAKRGNAGRHDRGGCTGCHSICPVGGGFGASSNGIWRSMALWQPSRTRWALGWWSSVKGGGKVGQLGRTVTLDIDTPLVHFP